MTEPLGDAFPDTQSDDRSGGRKRLVMIGGIGAVLAALGGGALLLLGGSGDVADISALPQKRPVAVSAKPTVTPTPTVIPVASEPNRHDPFKPLYPPKPTPPPTVAPTVPSASGSGVPGGTTDGSGGVVGPGSTGAPGATQNVVKLVSITGDNIPTVSITVDGTPYTGITGAILGSIAQVVSIRADDGAATFTMGEATFDLHIGQSYTN
ncbi:MAG: hypothetical protein JWM93_1390 [Frankiales bacterium]|nr:hypothetical protein [Frankiales bacterium]